MSDGALPSGEAEPRLPSVAVCESPVCRWSYAAYSATDEAVPPSAAELQAPFSHSGSPPFDTSNRASFSAARGTLPSGIRLALRATKVTAQALGQTMSTLVVQERHLWLTLADMRESDKHLCLDLGLCPRISGTQNFNKRAVSFSSGSQEGEDGSVRDLVSTLPSPSLFASGQQGPVRGRDAFSRIPCPTKEPGQCHTTHSDPTSRRTAFRVGPLCSISLPHRGYVSDSPGPACTVPGGLARAPQAVSLAPEDYQTRLRDSVRPASPQVQGHSVHLSVEQGCPCLACRSRGPTGLSRYHAARIASYETASALASRPSPEMGMAPRHIPGLQPMVGPCLSSGRSSPRASIQACCCFNRRLCHGLGGHVQRARSRGALDRAPAAVAYQLPRVAGSMACSAPLQNAATREAYTGPLGQHCDRCVHQPPGRSTLPSHVATRPPSPPLESEASEVASRRSCPRRAQSCSRRALTSARPSGRMATPPRGTPADLETLRGRSGRPVCLPGHVSLPVVFLPVRGDPRYGCAGMQLASGLTQICVSPSEPSRTDPVQGQGGRGASPVGGALLAQSDLVPRTDAPRDSPSLANSSEEGSTFSERGHPLAPRKTRPDLWNLHVWSLDGTRRF